MSRELRCAYCGKKLEDGEYVALDNWLQWHHYTLSTRNAYCSKECFADYWTVEWLDSDELDGDDDE